MKALFLLFPLFALLAAPAPACEPPAFVQSGDRQDSSLRLLRYLETLPPAPIMDGVGAIDFPITTSSPQAQRYFNQGVALLHDYWAFEALRAFRQAIRHDPQAAMPYWGVYRVVEHMARRANRFGDPTPYQLQCDVLQAATVLDAAASEREQAYIRVLAVRQMRARGAYLKELEYLASRYPDDAEALLWLVEALSGGYRADGYPRDGQLFRETLLRHGLVAWPEHHGVHHYWIHALEPGAQPERALASAVRVGELAPASGHIAHMPGHIYFRLGDYQRARAAFLRAESLEAAYRQRSGVATVYAWNRLHNLHYLVLTSAEQGRYGDALRWARQARELAAQAAPIDAYGRGTLFDQGWLVPAKLELRFGHWRRAAERLAEVDAEPFGPVAVLYHGALSAFASGMADPGQAQAAGARLQALRGAAPGVQEQHGVPDWLSPILGLAALELEGMIALVAGEGERAIALLRRAVAQEKTLNRGSDPPRNIRPALESLAQAYLQLGRWQQAGDAYRALRELRPNSGYALFGIARSHDLAGETAQAIAAYRRFLGAWRRADADQQRLARARLAELL